MSTYISSVQSCLVVPTVNVIWFLFVKYFGAKYLVFISSRSVKMKASSAFSICIIFEKSAFIFQFLNNKMYRYILFDINVHFFIQKLKNKYNFIQKYTNWESWGSSRQENLAFSVCKLFEESVFIFQFLNDKIYNYVLFDIIVNLIIQKFTVMFCFKNWKINTLSSKSLQTELS